VDNNGYVIAPLEVRPVNDHDSVLLPDSFEKLLDWIDLLNLLPDLRDSFFTLDSGFDSKYNKNLLSDYHFEPVIRPNRRSIKDPDKIDQLFENFDEDIYQERHKVERTFAWKHKYRKLVVRYERLKETSEGVRYLAYGMINLREFL